MKSGVNSFTAERIEEMRKHIDFSDIPEVTDFSKGYLRNRKPIDIPTSFNLDNDNLNWLKNSKNKEYQTSLNKIIRWARTNNCPIDTL